MYMQDILAIDIALQSLLSEIRSDATPTRADLIKQRGRKRQRGRSALATLHGQKGHTLRTHRQSGAVTFGY